MNRRALLFDLDGTLIDSLADLAASANHLRTHFDLEPAPLEEVRGWIGDGAVKLMQRALRPREFEPIAEEARRVFLTHHETQCVELVRPYPGVVEHLQRWRGDGVALGVVTNKPGKFGARILRHLGLDAFFGAAVYGDTLPERKPDPAPVREALRQLDAPASAAMLVGDGVQDLRAGAAAGVRTAAALFGFTDPARLREVGADEYWTAFGAVEAG